MQKYIIIKLNNGESPQYIRNIDELKVNIGDIVIIKFTKDNSLHEDSAEIIGFADKKVETDNSDIENFEILRLITPHDKQILSRHKEVSKDAMTKAIALSRLHNLDMKIIEAKISHDNKVLTLVFTAEERVDFRELLKDLAKQFKRQIRLRQIGPRDHAKILGDFGKCGRKQCCSSFLGDLGGITMEMARVQDITSKGASKISGNCGKLLCCLSYELEVYKMLRKELPRLGTLVKTPKGKGTVVDLEVLKQVVKVSLKQDKGKDSGGYDDSSYVYFPVKQIQSL